MKGKEEKRKKGKIALLPYMPCVFYMYPQRRQSKKSRASLLQHEAADPR